MRLRPGWFNHRNSGVWWNCLTSAVSIIDTSGERHSTPSCSPDHFTLHLAIAFLNKIWQANQLIRRSVEKIRSADFILEIEPKRTSSGRNSTTAKFRRTIAGSLRICRRRERWYRRGGAAPCSGCGANRRTVYVPIRAGRIPLASRPSKTTRFLSLLDSKRSLHQGCRRRPVTDPGPLSVSPDKAARLLRIDGNPERASHWMVQSLNPALGFLGALACEGSRQLELREWETSDL